MGDDGIYAVAMMRVHWESVQTPIEDTLTDITHNDNGIVYCVGHNGLVMSSNDGGKLGNINAIMI